METQKFRTQKAAQEEMNRLVWCYTRQALVEDEGNRLVWVSDRVQWLQVSRIGPPGSHRWALNGNVTIPS